MRFPPICEDTLSVSHYLGIVLAKTIMHDNHVEKTLSAGRYLDIILTEITA
jgi:hypothetical protein